MSKWFRISGKQDYLYLHVQKFHPEVTAVYYTVPDTPDGNDMVPPPSKVVRSRGKHNPGSGDYYCSHIYPPGNFSGWIIGNSAYLTHVGEVTFEKIVFGDDIWTYSFDGRHAIDTFYRGTVAWSSYTENHHWVEIGGKCSQSQWSAWERGYHSRDDMRAIAFAHEPGRYQYQWNGRWNNTDAGRTPDPTFEDRHLLDQFTTGSFVNASAYLNSAYVEAFKSLPAIRTNNIANLLQIYAGLKSIVELHNLHRSGEKVISSVGSLSDAWLGYRYSYSTTKSDIEELAMYADRMRALRHASDVTGRGVHVAHAADGDYVFRCSLTCSVDDLGDMYNVAEKFGLALDGYNAWDLIPYSFIVDWFLHIGDVLEKARDRNYAARLKPSAVWYSSTHEFTNSSGCHQCDYVRWHGVATMIDASHASSLLSHGSAKQSTWVKRGADAIALLM